MLRTIAHLSDDEAVAKMGHPILWLILDSVEGYEEEVNGQGHPEG